MSSALTVIILGHGIFLHTGPGTSPIVPNLPQIPTTNESLITSTPAPDLETRRPDYKYTPGIGAHKVHTEAVPWTEAWNICRGEGGHLAIINSLAESTRITQLVAEAGPIQGATDPDHAYIGIHNLFDQNEWVTVDGQSLAEAGFNEWGHGEPNNEGGNERCGSIYKVDGTLNDSLCDGRRLAFVCELPQN